MKIAVTNPADVVAVPPWDRPDFFWRDVPAVLKRLHDWKVTPKTVEAWIRKGVKGQTGERVFLPVFYRRNRMFVRLADLSTFLDAS